MPNYCKERVSVQTAHMFLEQAYDCMVMIHKICAVLGFDGCIVVLKCDAKNQSKSDFAVVFSKGNKNHQLTISCTDPLRHDMYACVLVRVQEAGGIDNLPETTFDKPTIEAHSKVLDDLVNWRSEDA